MAHFTIIKDYEGHYPEWEHIKDDGSFINVAADYTGPTWVYWTQKARADLSDIHTASELINALETALGETVTFDTSRYFGQRNPVTEAG